ncbi:hypothetical protein HC931_09810 [Candidatus Gracilibacteria bacterium]|nr:hypothetical protein [Candidatus Gracilibacteria bacterium]NJM86683.1 hypothetical protein [Hydrococcus sp. RU_2_2]NJQ98953.1 hypothetical protein [Hydrococcus sp. CSU_1_8]
MNSSVNFFKSLKLSRILVIFFAGILLFVSTACNQSPSVSKADGVDDNTPYRIQENTASQLRETYSTEPEQGGMNEHLDVDPRRDLTSPAAQADKLINQAERNIQQRRASNPKEAVDNLRETASASKVGNTLENATERVGQSLKEMKEGAQRGAQNLKENVESATDDVSTNVKRSVRDM